MPHTLLSKLNDELEATGSLPSSIWIEWLWRSNPEEAFAPSILMNRCHLLGLLVCRQQADNHQADNHSDPMGDTGGASGGAMGDTGGASGGAMDNQPCDVDERMTLMAKRPSSMTLRELKDTVDNILIEWPRFLDRLEDNPKGDENLHAVVGLIDACMARFGYLASNPGSPTIFDDSGSTEPHTDAEGVVRLSKPAMRRMIGSFLVLYRHIHMLARCETIDPIPHDCEIRKHHMEASTDDFHLLCMSMRLPVAARLNYKQDFPGMYNHVSQVVYFHDPQYERQVRVGMDKVSSGDVMQVLPALRQLYPEIELAYEEDHIDLSGPTGKWHWMVLPGRVYLISPDSSIYRSENVTSLLALYQREKMGVSLGAH
jgi:hypothetical protein